MRKKIGLLLIAFFMMLTGSLTAHAAMEKISLDGKTYWFNASSCRLYQQKGTQKVLVAKMEPRNLKYEGKYKNTIFFSAIGYCEVWAYKAGSKKFVKKQNNMVLSKNDGTSYMKGKYAIAGNWIPSDWDGIRTIYSYNMATNKRKCLSTNSYAVKIISGKVYYTKLYPSENYAYVMCSNMDGSGTRRIAKLTTGNAIPRKKKVNNLFGIFPEKNYCDISTWNGDVKRVYYSKCSTISLNKTAVTLKLKGTKTITLKAAVVGPSRKVQWSSSNNSVATVSGGGKVKAKKVGTAVIMAKANGKTAKCRVTVKKK